MICPNCGFKGNAKFCPQCGTPMEEMSLTKREGTIISTDERAGTTGATPDKEPAPSQENEVHTGPVYYSNGTYSKGTQQKQGIGAKFGAFWRKNKRNKVLVIIAALILISIVRSIIGGIGSPDIDKPESYAWPSNDMAQMIPEPEGKLTDVSTGDGDYLYATVECSKKQYDAFIDGCKEKGFDKKQDQKQYEDSYSYSAENKDAFTLSADYYDGQLSIHLNAPEEETEETEKPAKTDETAADKEEKSSDEVSADFKETMDEYEEFMNDYVDFMKKYEDSDDTAGMFADYGKMMAKYSEFNEKIEAIDEDELSDADYAYYMKVTGRVTEKLSEIY